MKAPDLLADEASESDDDDDAPTAPGEGVVAGVDATSIGDGQSQPQDVAADVDAAAEVTDAPTTGTKLEKIVEETKEADVVTAPIIQKELVGKKLGSKRKKNPKKVVFEEIEEKVEEEKEPEPELFLDEKIYAVATKVGLTIVRVAVHTPGAIMWTAHASAVSVITGVVSSLHSYIHFVLPFFFNLLR